LLMSNAPLIWTFSSSFYDFIALNIAQFNHGLVDFYFSLFYLKQLSPMPRIFTLLLPFFLTIPSLYLTILP
jgi:hypothetical protein